MRWRDLFRRVLLPQGRHHLHDAIGRPLELHSAPASVASVSAAAIATLAAAFPTTTFASGAASAAAVASVGTGTPGRTTSATVAASATCGPAAGVRRLQRALCRHGAHWLPLRLDPLAACRGWLAFHRAVLRHVHGRPRLHWYRQLPGHMLLQGGYHLHFGRNGPRRLRSRGATSPLASPLSAAPIPPAAHPTTEPAPSTAAAEPSTAFGPAECTPVDAAPCATAAAVRRRLWRRRQRRVLALCRGDIPRLGQRRAGRGLPALLRVLRRLPHDHHRPRRLLAR